ncbi:branched-chain amino acid ABC transporter substrate-binding protein [Streptomyces sp. SA15]|uniref:branched-chain amino acid ABC transporter substrate-binding protein n=1 Tax=Streptomyces sp. SA15 TaxID=934019 RepID=UPI000BAFCB37|nr:branched-chain amino acid ABC transporter substrate-binding protein [Streptomyces sp. SA15]PAZ14823.1 branched-chain amino acid ABC transporter substrate-binding protein [Streptomyces sp. SA15]
MAMPPTADRFPDDTGADAFVREFPMTVAPDDPAGLSTRPPLVILRIPETVTPADAAGPEYRARVRRVLGELELSLKRDTGGKLAPYALLWAGDHSGSDSLAETAGKELGRGIPRNMTPDRFPDFVLLREVLTYIRERPGTWSAPAPKELRNHAYRQRTERGGLPALLWSLSGGEAPPIAGLRGWLLGTWWRSITITFPRWCWARRQTARLIRPGRLSLNRRARWLGAELGVDNGREGLFEVLDGVAERQAPRLALRADHPNRAEALEALERLLVRALLEDLRPPSPGRALPKSRRRTARPVLLVEIPPEGTDGSEAAGRLVRALQAATVTVDRADATARTANRPGPLVIVAGRPSDALLTDLDAEECGLSRAAERMRGSGGPPVVVNLQDEPFSRDGLPIRRVAPRLFKVRGSTQTSLVTSLALVAVTALAYGVVRIVSPLHDTSCVGGDVAVAERTEPLDLKAGDLYEQAFEEIEEQNERAVKFAEKQNRTVRTVVYFGSAKPTNDSTTALFDGSVPELRGIALWQSRLNREAVSNIKRVPLYVDVRYTGPRFANAEKQAAELVEELKQKPGKQHREIVGVLGYSQSRTETKNALTILGKAGIPVVGTTASADEMLGSVSYWPFAPLNSVEAEISANFAFSSNIVARADGPDGQPGCTPAKRAVVVHTSTDLYSKGLADRFVEKFPGTTDVVDFSQDDDAPAKGVGTIAAPDDLAAHVCQELQDHQEAVVYWAARARDFTAFVHAFDRRETCAANGLTVLGGNELTNMEQTGEYGDKTWLRLYHTAYRLPSADGRATDTTRRFVQEYDGWVNGSPENDPWRHDGHSAMAYDAFRLLSQSVDFAAKYSLTPAGVQSALGSGVSFGFEGATGFISRSQDGNQPPAGKTLVILRQSAEGPVAVAACGAYQHGETYSKQGPPCPE